MLDICTLVGLGRRGDLADSLGTPGVFLMRTVTGAFTLGKSKIGNHPSVFTSLDLAGPASAICLASTGSSLNSRVLPSVHILARPAAIALPSANEPDYFHTVISKSGSSIKIEARYVLFPHVFSSRTSSRSSGRSGSRQQHNKHKLRVWEAEKRDNGRMV